MVTAQDCVTECGRPARDATACRHAIQGYQQAINTLQDVAHRTGSPAAKWAANYLTTDPDKLGPAHRGGNT